MNECVHFLCLEKGSRAESLRKLEAWKGRTRGQRGGDENTEVRQDLRLLWAPAHSCLTPATDAGKRTERLALQLGDFEVKVDRVLLTAGSGVRGVELGHQHRMGGRTRKTQSGRGEGLGRTKQAGYIH